jgi:hypothetical protein
MLLLGQQLLVPLQSDRKRMFWDFDRLDHPIRRVSDGPNTGTNNRNRHPVETIDLNRCAADHLPQARALDERDGVHRLSTVMFQRAGQIGL